MKKKTLLSLLAITIGSVLTDFQVSVGIGTSALIASGKMKSDCSDIHVDPLQICVNLN